MSHTCVSDGDIDRMVTGNHSMGKSSRDAMSNRIMGCCECKARYGARHIELNRPARDNYVQVGRYS